MFLLRRPRKATGSGDGTKIAKLMDLHNVCAPSGNRGTRSVGKNYLSNRNYILDLSSFAGLDCKGNPKKGVRMPEKDKQVVKYGDVTQRVGVDVIRARGVDVEKLIKMLVANAAAEFASTYYYYTILRMHLAGHEDYK